jgi:hypothetical protein
MATGGGADFTIPPNLMAQIQAAADQERRSALDVLNDAVQGYLKQGRSQASQVRRTPAEAAERMLRTRRPLPAGETIRDLTTHGRA